MHPLHIPITRKLGRESAFPMFKVPRVVKHQLFHQEPVWDEISGYSDSV